MGVLIQDHLPAVDVNATAAVAQQLHDEPSVYQLPGTVADVDGAASDPHASDGAAGEPRRGLHAATGGFATADPLPAAPRPPDYAGGGRVAGHHALVQGERPGADAAAGAMPGDRVRVFRAGPARQDPCRPPRRPWLHRPPQLRAARPGPRGGLAPHGARRVGPRLGLAGRRQQSRPRLLVRLRGARAA